MKIGILTSSRADYGIYRPLLQKLKDDPFFETEMIAFGTHLSALHGHTLSEIERDGYGAIHTVSSLLTDDSAAGIAGSYGLTTLKFADFWNRHHYDLVFCLGDRFEMSAAVQAGIPFHVKFAHLHGGETTLGAIDNIYRHQITLASVLHFTATEAYREKVQALTGGAGAFNVGSLSIDELDQLHFMRREAFLEKFQLPDDDFALITFHPETMVTAGENHRMASEMKTALAQLSDNLHLVITMPNADTLGSVFREEIHALKNEIGDKLTIIENFGKENYFNAMKHARIMIGNTSSGIIEAASFGKYVVNAGDRQKGRITSPNVIDSRFDADHIVERTRLALQHAAYNGPNVYYRSGAADTIISIIKNNHAKPQPTLTAIGGQNH